MAPQDPDGFVVAEAHVLPMKFWERGKDGVPVLVNEEKRMCFFYKTNDPDELRYTWLEPFTYDELLVMAGDRLLS